MWYQIQDNSHVRLRIIAKPNAKHSSLVRITDEGLHIALHAKPKQGEANTALIAFLAEWLGTPKTRITLERGDKSRYKFVCVPMTAALQTLIDSHPSDRPPNT